MRTVITVISSLALGVLLWKGVDFISLAATRRSWRLFAEQHGLCFEPGSFNLLGYSTPHTVHGRVGDRQILGSQNTDDILGDQFTTKWMASIRVSTKTRLTVRAVFSHNWIWMFVRTKHRTGDRRFDKFVRVETTSQRYVRNLLESREFRMKVKSLVSPTFGPISELTLTRNGNLFLQSGITISARLLAKRLEILLAIADRLENQT